MKKILTILIAAAMLAAPAAAFAAPYSAAASINDTDAMTQALLAVKSRVDIPQELTDFESHSTESDGRIIYYFRWSSKDDRRELMISSDYSGRILTLNEYDESRLDTSSRPKLVSLSREEMRSEAEKLLAQLAPGTVSDIGDALVFDTLTPNERGCSASFKRIRNGVEVYGNNAYIGLEFDGSSIVSRNAAISFDYDAVFETEGAQITDPAAAYRAQFPEEMVYQKEYSYWFYRKDSATADDKINLIYRIADDGYVSAYTGEKVELQSREENRMYTEATVMDNGSLKGAGNGLSPEESAELDKIAGLYTSDEAESFLRSIPELKLTPEMTRENAYLTHRRAQKDEYTLGLSLTDGAGRYLSADFDAARNYLTSLYNSEYSVDRVIDEELTDAQKQQCAAMADSFLEKAAADKLSEFKLDKENTAGIYNRKYVREVNGIPYVNNTLTIYALPDMITSYDLSYDNDALFPGADNAMTADAGYAKLLEAAPIEKQYIPAGEEYRLVFTRENSVRTDAFTGEIIGAYNDFNASDAEYDDIAGHWCEEEVKALRDNGIAFEGGSFKPDEPITQTDLLRLFLAGTMSKSFMNSEADRIFDLCMRRGILEPLIKRETPQNAREETFFHTNAEVSREAAFIFLVRMLGYDEVARLSDIYKITYADGDKLTDGAIGYAAILSGMGIIEGDGSALRPQDSITRAEAATMIYRYMKQ